MSEAKKKENKTAKLKPVQKGGSNRDRQQRVLEKSSSAIRSFIFSPTFNVIALACLLVAVFAGVRLVSARRNPAQLAFVERAAIDTPETETAENLNYSAPEIFRGEVYDTSIRLRETGALGMAMSLAVFAEFSERKIIPTNLETVLSSVQMRGLMPPEMTIQNGSLISKSSIFVIRYRSQPLAFEILSSPKQNTGNSPALLLRFPLASLDKRTITYFQAARANNFEMPEPFAPLEKVVAAGWTLEQWRGELLPKDLNAAQILAEEKLLLNEAAASR